MQLFARGHALQCPGVAIEVRARLIQNSQAGRLMKKTVILTPPANSTLGGQSLTSVRKLGLLKDATKNTKRFKQTSLICSTEDGKVTTMCVCVCGLRLRLGYSKCMRYQSLVPSR
jgi:hypothetical protein